ncbi:glycoside hydrolase 5 family protein [Croceicoccus marinus]|jgi:mannan endo-1,4-beta-mannosidase|uniref:mannan endo-1,4-beta-mannosidase n=1 Tax=Croceicoccus marinus TaxID=450378 RepID=A0A7G6VQS5_9SPHN|nr:mannanase [Croceicoccus marinus]QNE04090.1 mannanase [Croceicoccus marinus]
MKLARRQFIAAAGAATVTACTSPRASLATSGFVTRDGMRLMQAGTPYRIVGANMWYAAWLGANAEYGDRARLLRELDRLAALGVNNLRIMASGEEGPLRNSISPGFTRRDGSPNDALVEGLDFAMAEMARRSMTAVLVLSNFWEWSGGLQTILWRATGDYMDMGDPAHPWPAFADATANFYADGKARALYADHVEAMVSRTNSVTGVAYRDDPAILSWQLANEPRPGGSAASIARSVDAYYDWIDESAAQIRALDPHHLVSLGQEGTMATSGDEAIVRRAHRNIDYVTAHIWPLNWDWVAGDALEASWPAGRRKTADYIAAHDRIAASLDKPLIIEEFGFPRDEEAYSPEASTRFREQFYREIYAAVEAGWLDGGPLIGSNFWAWNGEARAQHDDARFVAGDRAYMGDPPHEPQGWYGNFDSDQTMLALVHDHARRSCLGLAASCPA